MWSVTDEWGVLVGGCLLVVWLVLVSTGCKRGLNQGYSHKPLNTKQITCKCLMGKCDRGYIPANEAIMSLKHCPKCWLFGVYLKTLICSIHFLGAGNTSPVLLWMLFLQGFVYRCGWEQDHFSYMLSIDSGSLYLLLSVFVHILAPAIALKMQHTKKQNFSRVILRLSLTAVSPSQNTASHLHGCACVFC